MSNMSSNKWLWTKTKDDLVRTIEDLDFRAELGEAIAGHLGSPKAIGVAHAPRKQASRAPRTEMERMIAYLHYVKPRKEELVIDEMLAIRSEIDAWRDKKASQEANARYNEMLYYGLTDNEE